MRMPTTLRKLDDRVLGDRLKGGGHESEPDPQHERHPQHEQHAEQERRHHDAHPDVYPEEGRRQVRTTRAEPAEPTTSDGLRDTLRIVYQVSSLVFVALAVAVLAGILFTLAPTNPDNGVVSGVLDVAASAAGPFSDVFTFDNPDTALAANYGLAAAVYLVLASLVRRLPTGGSSTGT